MQRKITKYSHKKERKKCADEKPEQEGERYSIQAASKSRNGHLCRGRWSATGVAFYTTASATVSLMMLSPSPSWTGCGKSPALAAASNQSLRRRPLTTLRMEREVVPLTRSTLETTWNPSTTTFSNSSSAIPLTKKEAIKTKKTTKTVTTTRSLGEDCFG